MNKLMKFISVFLTSIVLIVSAIPSVSAVYASEQVSQIETNMELQPVTSLTEEQINTLANEIQFFHPDVSQQWIKEVINRHYKAIIQSHLHTLHLEQLGKVLQLIKWVLY